MCMKSLGKGNTFAIRGISQLLVYFDLNITIDLILDVFRTFKLMIFSDIDILFVKN